MSCRPATVVDVDGGRLPVVLPQRPTREHDGQPVAQAAEGHVAGVVRDDEHPVDVAAEEEAPRLVRLRRRRDEERERVLGGGEVRHRALDQGREERVGEHPGGLLRHHERQRVRAAPGERPGRPVGHVVELRDGGVHGRERLGGDPGGSVHHPRHRRPADPGERADHLEGGRVLLGVGGHGPPRVLLGSGAAWIRSSVRPPSRSAAWSPA
jgi:hypothetical protein